MNYADPSGMMGVGAVLGNVLGIITGLILMAPTGGASGVEVMMGVAEIGAVTASASMAASGNEEGAKVAGVVAGVLGLTSLLVMGGASAQLPRRGASASRAIIWEDIKTSASGGRRVHTSGYTNKFRGIKGQESLSVHSSGSDNLWIGSKVDLTTGQVIVPGQKLDVPNFISKLEADYNVKLQTQVSDPLYLIACRAKTGLAQEMANALDRPVVAFSKKNSDGWRFISSRTTRCNCFF
ncbi:hypothetical protein HJ158_24585 [Vibrio parahaemolyticus]|nr:hypothetical protein [Vibrio parahaemolyticus]